jgi:hypothetical protein
MPTSKNFSEYYKTITDTELLNILDNPEDYQPLAVDAAKNEFTNRRLSDTEIQEARQQLITKQSQKEKEREIIKVVEAKIKTAGHNFSDTINPIQSGIPSAERIIRFIVIIFGGIFLYQLITDLRTHWAYVGDFKRFPMATSFYLLPQILLPVAIIAFWKRKTFGWTLLTIFLTFSAVGAILVLVQLFSWRSSGSDVLDSLFPRPSATTYIFQLLFLTGTIYMLCKTTIRNVFSVSKQKMSATIIIAGLVTFVLMLTIS